MSFKLLAIRPLDGCNKKFLKNLEENRIYQFYNDYEFYKDKKEEVIKIDRTKNTVPENLYDIYDIDHLQINISAIVGKNGSGKSSLVELFYVAFYNLSVIKKILNNKKTIKEIESLKNEINSSNSGMKNEYLKVFNNISSGKLLYENDFDEINKFVNDLDIEKTEEDIKIIRSLSDTNIIVVGIMCEVFFLLDGEYFKLKISEKNIKVYIHSVNDNKFINKNINDLLKNNFFYSLAINYSFYALNSNEVGVWVKKIFHKNDSYQTPIVLNPMRTDGNINVNTEIELLKSRLFYNLIAPFVLDKNKEMPHLINGKVAKKIVVKINKKKFLDDDLLEQNIRPTDQVHTDIYKHDYFPIVKKAFKLGNIDEDNYLNKLAIEYLLKKIVSIISKYSTYKNFLFDIFIENFDIKKFEEIINYMAKDKSHITLKLRQTLNFLKHDKIIHEKFEKSGDSFEIEIKDELAISLKNIISDPKNKDIDLSDILIPSFLDYDIIFENGSNFSSLSSGEKQKIFSINSLLYHLSNINSVFNNDDKKLNRYKYVNIIFDEIELYYHPDMQRNFINDLRNDIKKISIPKIKAINIIFITHSPFILSDIPNSNVLFLEYNKDKKFAEQLNDKCKTFGANVHDLLADSFFMNKDGYVGEFAKDKIKSAIDYLIKYPNASNDWNQENIKQFINLISEPLIRNSLKELYYDKILNSISEKKKEIERLKELIKIEENR